MTLSTLIAAMSPAETAARTAWAENRGGGQTGMQSVLNAIGNRAGHPAWWGDSVASVCTYSVRAIYQFSCWSPRDPNYAELLAVTEDDADFALAMRLAAELVAGTLPDLTHGADSYYALSMRSPPTWRLKSRHTVNLAGQAFYVTRGLTLTFPDEDLELFGA
ncbi:MAG: cell wall hydrolase [Janthinobacterium lividum]